MKYSNKIKTPWRFSLTIFFIVFSILTGILVALLIAFPIRITDENMEPNDKWYAKLFVVWPQPALKSEIAERKKIKRYSRLEIQRKLGKQLKNMEFLNTPLYDLWLDKTAEVITNNSANLPDNSSFFWPVLLDNRSLFTENKGKIGNRNLYFVLFPDFEKVSIRHGVYLGSGEMLKSNIPVSNSKKYLIFEALVLAPGSVKISLGQYVWTKTFNENSVNKTAKFFIPINDSLAQNYRLSNISSSFYVLDMKIVTITPNGREPIYVSSNSRMWSVDANSGPVVKPRNDVGDLNKDPLTEVTNSNILSNRDSILAKAYNTLFISIYNLDPDLIGNQKKFAELMPALATFYRDSFVIKNMVNTTSYPDDKNKILRIYKTYGYKTSMFSDPESFNLDENLTSFKDFQSVSRAWLNDSDANFKQQSNDKGETKPEPEGLNAIFKSGAKEKLNGLQQEQFHDLSQYFNSLSSAINNTNNLDPEENFLIAKKHYIPNLLDTFQTWTKSQNQNRLFIDLALNTAQAKVLPTLQDLGFALIKKPTLNLKKLDEYAKMHTIDREFKQIIDTLQARRLTHRTLVFVVLKNPKQPDNSTALIFVPGLKPKQAPNNLNISIRDLAFYAMSVVGIPIEDAVKFAPQYINLETQKEVVLKTSAEFDDSQHTRYNLMVYPNIKNCQPFIWVAANVNIFNIKSNFPFYELSNSNKLTFFPCNFKENILKIEWYQKTSATLSRGEAQRPSKVNVNQKLSHTNHIYGYFLPSADDTKNVDMYFGKRLINQAHFPLNFKHTPEQMHELFIVDKKEIDQIYSLAVRSFRIMRLDSGFPQKTQAALLISNAYSD